MPVINCRLSIVSYFCIRIDVDRFVLLATTGKNAKNKSFLLPSGKANFPSSIHSFDLLTVNCKLSVGFIGSLHYLSIVNCRLSIQKTMSYLFTSESVSEGHPDKVADQISDALLDEFLAYDKNSKVACETLVTTGQVVLAGEVKSSAYVDVQDVARNVIEKIGYTKSEYQFEAKSCGVFSSIHEQSGDINRGVEREDPYNQGAGDQGMMFGYATNETENYMPLALDLSHSLLWELAEIRKNENDLMPYLRPDAKSQVTIEYDDNGKPLRIDTIVVSTQHDEFITAKGITQE